MFVGGLMVQVIRYFMEAHKVSPLPFFGACGVSALCFASALFVLTREWNVQKALSNLIALFLCIYAGFFLMWWAAHQLGKAPDLQNPTVQTIVTVLSFQGAAVVLTHFFLREHGVTWAEGFGFNNRIPRALLLGFIVALVAVPCTWVMQGLTVHLLNKFDITLQEQEAVRLLRGVEVLLDRLVLGFATIILAPLGEEIMFRGILYPAIKARGFPHLALWGTAALFAVIHLNLPTLLPLMFLAIVLTLLYEQTNNLLACVLAHGLFNAANFITLYFVPNSNS